jgi:hypothetical protein
MDHFSSFAFSARVREAALHMYAVSIITWSSPLKPSYAMIGEQAVQNTRYPTCHI